MNPCSTKVAVAAVAFVGMLQACGGGTAISVTDGGAGAGGGSGGRGGAGAAAGGSGGSGGACGGESACGGNIVGTWTITASCNPQGTGMVTGFCAQAPVSVSGFNEMGTYTFNANMTFVLSETVTGTETVLYLPECLAQAGAPSCDDLNSIYASFVGSVYSAGGCATTASGCLCTVQIDSLLSQSGSYATAGVTLTLVPSGATTSGSGSYCVQGSTLTLTSMSMSGTSTMTSTVALTRTSGP